MEKQPSPHARSQAHVPRVWSQMPRPEQGNDSFAPAVVVSTAMDAVEPVNVSASTFAYNKGKRP